jgi:hypothetical protein
MRVFSVTWITKIVFMKLLEFVLNHPEELIRAGRLAFIVVRRLLERKRAKKQNPDKKPG